MKIFSIFVLCGWDIHEREETFRKKSTLFIDCTAERHPFPWDFPPKNLNFPLIIQRKSMFFLYIEMYGSIVHLLLNFGLKSTLEELWPLQSEN
jgi:hypothetical protein